jgi:aspartate racemase
MELPFYRERLADARITVLVPDEPDRSLVHEIIYRELVRGIVTAESRAKFLQVIDRLRARGAQGVIAGCTEIEVLVREDDLDCKLFPTARLHALAAVDAALDG